MLCPLCSSIMDIFKTSKKKYVEPSKKINIEEQAQKVINDVLQNNPLDVNEVDIEKLIQTEVFLKLDKSQKSSVLKKIESLIYKLIQLKI